MVIKNIIEALKTEESVFITEVGLFKKVFVSSHLENGKLVPPENKIVFENVKDGNSFAFIIFLSKNENIRIVDADIEIKKWVEDFKAVIENDDKVEFDNFGVFTRGADDTFTFESSWIKELNLEFEGMEPILPEVAAPAPVKEKVVEKTVEVEKEEKQPVSPQPEKSRPLKIAEKEAPVSAEVRSQVRDLYDDYIPPEHKTPVPRTPKRRRKTDVLFFVMVIVCSVAFLTYLFKDPLLMKYSEIKGNHFTKETEPEEEVPDLETVVPESETINTEEEAPEVEVIQEIVTRPEPVRVAPAPVAKQPQPKSTPAPAAVQHFPVEEYVAGYYYVIGGSFGKLENAERKAVELRKLGLSPKILQQPGSKMVRISVGKYPSEAEANAEAAKYVNFWVLK